MWTYERKLQYPIKIKKPNAKAAQLIISQLGGPDGELNAAMRYLNQRYSMPYRDVVGILTDVGTEELAHLEMVATILYQLTQGLSESEIESSPFAPYFIDHTTGIYPAASAGFPDTMSAIAVKGDIITDLTENLAADAAIIKEQPLRKKSRKPLKYKDFSHLGKTLKKCIPAII